MELYEEEDGEIDQCKEGVSCFPSRQCSIRLCSAATTNLSHSSLSRKTNVKSSSLSLSPPQAPTYDLVPPIPHINTPSKHLNSNESPTKIVDNIQPHNFSDQSQINTMVSDHTDHRPRAGHTCLSHIYACKYLIYQQTTPSTHIRGSTHRERNDPCKSSNSELNKNEQRSIACGGEFKVKAGYMLGGSRRLFPLFLGFFGLTR